MIHCFAFKQVFREKWLNKHNDQHTYGGRRGGENIPYNFLALLGTTTIFFQIGTLTNSALQESQAPRAGPEGLSTSSLHHPQSALTAHLETGTISTSIYFWKYTSPGPFPWNMGACGQGFYWLCFLALSCNATSGSESNHVSKENIIFLLSFSLSVLEGEKTAWVCFFSSYKQHGLLILSFSSWAQGIFVLPHPWLYNATCNKSELL